MNTQYPPYHESLTPDNEKVRTWVNRFISFYEGHPWRTRPNSIDLTQAGVFYYARFKKKEEEDHSLNLRLYVIELLTSTFDNDDWYVTNDLRVWFTTEDQVITFKLTFNR